MSTVLVVGTGSIGSRHLTVLRSLPHVKPVALPVRESRNRELEQMGFLVCTSIEHARDLGAAKAIIASDTRQHLADAECALRAGFDVLVEKPLAANSHDAKLIAGYAASRKRNVFVGCNLRFNTSLNAFRTQLPRIGAIHAVRIESQSYLPDWRPSRPYLMSYSAREEDGGVLRDLIHELDYSGWLFGWPDVVQAALGNIGKLKIAAEESADLLWEVNSATVSVRLDYLTRPARRKMRADGINGSIEWDGVTETVTIALGGGAPVTEVFSEPRDRMYARQDAAFLNFGREPEDDRLTTVADGIKALAVCDAARLASSQRATQSVSY